MFKKQDIINALFVSAFPIYGIGKYMMKVSNFSVGNTIAILPGILLLLFALVDALYTKEIRWRLTPAYFLILLFTGFCLYSVYTALGNNVPGVNQVNAVTLCLFIFTCLHAAIVVQAYNENSEFSIEHLLYLGLTVDIILNLLGYVVGLRNAVHSIDGRLNLPFGQGFYAVANTVAILNILIIGKLLHGVQNHKFKIFLICQLGFNLFLMLGFNSRLSTLIFLLSTGILVFRLWKLHRLIFFTSLFTLPFLLNFSECIYDTLQLPVFKAVLKRVSYEDITGFNGRRDLWEAGLGWIETQGSGLLFGNGYRGHYVIGLLEELEQFWFKSAVNMHMHSSFLEFSLSIGVLGTIVLLTILYFTIKNLVRDATEGHDNYVLLGVLFYLLFLFQIDNYVYIFNYGSFILFTIVSSMLVTKTSLIKSYGKFTYINSNTFIQPGEIHS